MKTKKIYLPTSILLLGLLLIITISTILTIKTTAINTFSKNFVYCENFSIYLLASNSSPLEDMALEIAKDEMACDFSGYVWNHNNKFLTIINAHLNKNDALILQEDLKQQQISSKIYKVDIPEIKHNHFEKSLQCQIDLFKDIYLKLFDLSLCLDTKLLTETEVLNKVCEIVEKFNLSYREFEVILNKNKTTSQTLLNENLLKLKNFIANLKNQEFVYPTQTFSSLIKHTCVNILDDYNNFAKNLLTT